MRIDEVTDSINSVINQFKQEHADSVAYGCKRNNCGLPAADLVQYAKKHGYDVKRVRGEFVVDNPEFDFDDFTQQEKQNMKFSYLDPKNKADRIKFATKHNLIDELKKVPHYWNEYAGSIIDLTGHAQFVKTGLASDLNLSRYIKGTQ